MRTDGVLELRRRHVLTACGDDQFLLPAGDVEIAVLEAADVAGVEPVIVDRLGGGLRVVPIAGEHHRSLQQHLAILGDATDTPGTGRPTDPTRWWSSLFAVTAAVVSDRPYPS